MSNGRRRSAEIRVMREDLRPPAPPPKRHFISIADVTRDDVERAAKVLGALVAQHARG